MRTATGPTTGSGIALILAIALMGCSKAKQSDPRDTGRARAEAKRQQTACASSAAYDRLKSLLFDRAIGAHEGDRANLDTLADYSLARMEDPVVKGWDPALDVTRCAGRLILQIPAGAERAFGGEHRLQANIEYTAQAAADGSGFVYQLKGAEQIVAKLAAFNLTRGAYRPPPAIDEQQAGLQGPEAAEADMTAPLPRSAPTRSPAARLEPVRPETQQTFERASERAAVEPGGTGEAAVRAFYAALGEGDGEAASARIVPDKRTSRAFSPEAISRFYGGLPEPIRLTQIVALGRGAYRVNYRYSAGRSRCNGRAVVSLTSRGGGDFIRSIKALDGC